MPKPGGAGRDLVEATVGGRAAEPGRADAPRADAPRAEAVRVDAARADAGRADSGRAESVQFDGRGGADSRRPRKGAHQRPVRTFRAIGVFVLVLGAVAGVYAAVSRPGTAPDTNLSLDVVDVPVSGSAAPSVDPSHQQALTDAQQKAAQAAADAANLAKQADDAAKRQAEEQAASRSQERTQATQKATTPNYPVPSSCSEYSGNRAIGCGVLLETGFGLDQMPCLDKLWTKESHWNPLAKNASSGAYGIPQALPGDKMAGYGDDWQTNPVPQVKWGLAYIKNRYGTPCDAWAHSQAKGWY
jgi:hypothetical protein